MLAAVVGPMAAATFVFLTAIANRAPPVMLGYVSVGGSWGLQVAAGLQRTADDFKIEYGTVIGAGPAAVLAMQRVVDADPDLALLGWGSLYPDVMEELAGDHPGMRFALVDFEPDPSSVQALPNTSFTVFANHEGSFLAGAIAAMKTDAMKKDTMKK